MVIVLEGLFMCLLLLLTCVIGIANGPVGLVVLYEQDVQNRVVQLGLTTKAAIRKRFWITCIALFAPMVILTPLLVYGLNGAVGFREGFWQMSAILWIQGLFDRLFIDWFWVGHTQAWVIPGTEDLRPYIPGKTLAVKWLGTVFGSPLIAGVLAGVITWLRPR